jgi:DsbC/DsbD-like thiol-disulfide interchange protein
MGRWRIVGYNQIMIRTLFLLLIIALGGSLARASDLISAPTDGASPVVKQPRETAQLIPEMTLVESGKPFDVILHLHSDPDWHTYWINPGDAGLATTIKWTLPDGFTAGPIQWPTPEKHDMGGLMTYGYAGDVYLLTTITPPATTTANMSKIEIKAHAEWLVCQEECIPGHADLTVALSFVDKNAPLGVSAIENKELFTAARGRLPVPNTRWDVKAGYAKSGSIFEIAWMRNRRVLPPSVIFCFSRNRAMS